MTVRVESAPDVAKTLLFVDGPGGPSPSWYAPRLRDHRVRFLWTSSGDAAADTARVAAFDAAGDHVELAADSDLYAAVCAHGRELDADGVLAFSERVAADCHRAAALLGLPSTAPDAAVAVKNKRRQRELLAAAGLPGPPFFPVASAETLARGIREIGGPAVLKPEIGVGSAATYAVDASTDVRRLWAEAERAYVGDPRGTGRMNFILEGRMVGIDAHQVPGFGDQASVETLVHHGTCTHLTVTDKLPLAPVFRETGDITPSTLPRKTVDEMRDMTETAIAALGLDHCAVHTEFKLTAEGPRIIEVNGRLGGGVAQLLDVWAGYDIVRACAAVAVGAAPPPIIPVPGFAAHLLPQPPTSATVLTGRPDRASLLRLPGVREVDLLHPEGTRLDWRRGTSARLARVVARSDAVEDLLALNDALIAPGTFSFADGPS